MKSAENNNNNYYKILTNNDLSRVSGGTGETYDTLGGYPVSTTPYFCAACRQNVSEPDSVSSVQSNPNGVNYQVFCCEHCNEYYSVIRD
jgi:bacteriocin-like protein